MKAALITLLILTLCFKSKAQQNIGAIKATIKDIHNVAIPGATARIFKTGDTIAIKAGSSDNFGQIAFENLVYGTYILRVSAVGLRDYEESIFQLNRINLELPSIILLPGKSIGLTEVMITSKKPLIETEIDRTTVNVSAMISSASSNSLEVLEKTPGVTVNANGEITLNGRPGVMVLIDGRQIYLSAQGLANYLKTLPGGMLDKIELMENPPAKYDAAGNAIINLKLKKNRTGGLTGSLQNGYSQGRYAKNNNSLNLNYNHEKLNVFSNFSYNLEKAYTSDNYERFFNDYLSELKSRILLDNHTISRSNGLNVVVGVDYNISEYTTYGAQVSFNKSNQKNNYRYYNETFNPSMLDSTGSGGTFIKDEGTNHSANINYAHKFGKSGREISVDANYLNYESRNEQSLHNFTYAAMGEPLSYKRLFYYIPAEIHVYNAKADYIHPLKDKAKLEAGVKTSFVNNDNMADYYNIINQVSIINNSQSNHFKYSENINAAYLNVQKSWKHLSLQAGLRAENTHAKGRQLGNAVVAETQFIKNYTQLFPSLFINYKLDTISKQSFNLSISRRISRPNYQLLNPFIFIRDRFSNTSGNPLLTPQYQYRYDIKYQYRQALRLGLSHNRFTDIIFRTTSVKDDIFTVRPQNIGRGFMYILNAGSSLSPNTWWNFNVDVQIARMGLNGEVDGITLNPRKTVFRGGMQNQFTISKRLSAEVFGNYVSGDLNGQIYTHAIFRTNAAVQLKILNDKGSIRFNVDDIFHSWIYHYYSVDLKQANYTQVTESDTRRFGIGFTYRFGNDLFKRKRKYDSTGLDDEKGRLQP